MHLPLDYMLKMGLCLAATGMFYFLLLRRLTQYTWNRWFLLACTALSFIVPLININRIAAPAKLTGVFFINHIPSVNVNSILTAANNNSDNFKSNIQLLFVLLFIVTALLLAGRFIIQFISLKKITAKAQLLSRGAGDIYLYNIEDDIAPFSFGRHVYINKSMYSPTELEEVIRHETVHVNQRHTLDVMIAELVCILNWYNPFAWLLKTAIKQNLEFIADDVVLKGNIDKKYYQYLLLKVTGNIPFAITNNLNFTSLKNRIAMMNKTKTSKLHLLKFILIIPLACIMLLAFRQAYDNKAAEPQQKTKEAPGETFTLGALTYAINDAGAERLVKEDEDNSFLKPGNVISLSSIKNEKFRLAGLLQKNGYDTSGSHSISFEVDTFSTSKSFSVQVNINIPPHGSAVKPKNKTTVQADKGNKLSKASATGNDKINAGYNMQHHRLLLPVNNLKTIV